MGDTELCQRLRFFFRGTTRLRRGVLESSAIGRNRNFSALLAFDNQFSGAGFDSLKLALRSTGSAGAEGACARREVKLSLEHRSWLNRRVCVMDLSDASRRMGVRVDGFIGTDVLSEFSAVRIDYKAQTVTLEADSY